MVHLAMRGLRGLRGVRRAQRCAGRRARGLAWPVRAARGRHGPWLDLVLGHTKKQKRAKIFCGFGRPHRPRARVVGRLCACVGVARHAARAAACVCAYLGSGRTVSGCLWVAGKCAAVPRDPNTQPSFLQPRNTSTFSEIEHVMSCHKMVLCYFWRVFNLNLWAPTAVVSRGEV